MESQRTNFEVDAALLADAPYGSPGSGIQLWGPWSKLTMRPQPTVAGAAIGWFKLNASNASSNPKPPNEAEPGTARCRFRRKTLHLHAIDDS